jgi:hypothetical protein
MGTDGFKRVLVPRFSDGAPACSRFIDQEEEETIHTYPVVPSRSLAVHVDVII